MATDDHELTLSPSSWKSRAEAAEQRVRELEEELGRVRDHCLSYGMDPERVDAIGVGACVEQHMVSHCAVETCSWGNLPDSHWCEKHQRFVAEAVQFETKLATAIEALEEIAIYPLGLYGDIARQRRERARKALSKIKGNTE